MSDITTSSIRAAVARRRASDGPARRAANDELIAGAYECYRVLATAMLNDFGVLRRVTDSASVYQGAWLTLLKALEAVSPNDEEHLRRLVRQHIRWRLQELLRGNVFHHWEGFGDAGSGGEPPDARVPAPGSLDPARIAEKKDEWERFLAATAELPEREAAVFERIYFERMSQQEVAEEMGVSVALVRLRWAEAKKTLAERLCGVAKTDVGGE